MYCTHTTYYESHRFNYAWAQINNLRLLPLFLCYDSGVFTPISKEDPFILHIRPVKHTDADMLFTFFEQLDRETNFLLFETGERILSLQQLENPASTNIRGRLRAHVGGDRRTAHFRSLGLTPQQRAPQPACCHHRYGPLAILLRTGVGRKIASTCGIMGARASDPPTWPHRDASQ